MTDWCLGASGARVGMAYAHDSRIRRGLRRNRTNLVICVILLCFASAGATADKQHDVSEMSCIFSYW